MDLQQCVDMGTTESIHTLRLAAIERLLKLPYDVLDRYEAEPFRGCHVPASIAVKENCDALTYGSITLGLQRAGLWPRVQAEDVGLSVESLAYRIKEIKILRAPTAMVNPPGILCGHDNCCVRDFKEQVRGIMAGIMSPVLESHRRHMTTQKYLAR